MKWFFTLATSGWGEALICLLILFIMCGTIYLIIDRISYRLNIFKHGWPPVYMCDHEEEEIVEEEEDY